MENKKKNTFSPFIQLLKNGTFLILLISATYFVWIYKFESFKSELDIIGQILKNNVNNYQIVSPDTGRLKFYYMAQFDAAPVILICELPRDSSNLIRISKKGNSQVKTIELVKK